MIGCLICGRKGRWQDHHPTGRGSEGEYLDPEFTVPLCHDHHTLVHDDLKTLGLEGDTLTLSDPIVLRLARLAVLAARAGEIGLCAELFGRWADEILSGHQDGACETPDSE